MYSVSMISSPGRMISHLFQCGWEANGSVFTSKMVFECLFSKVLSAIRASSQTSKGLAGNCCGMIAKQVY